MRAPKPPLLGVAETVNSEKQHEHSYKNQGLTFPCGQTWTIDNHLLPRLIAEAVTLHEVTRLDWRLVSDLLPFTV